MTNKQLEDWTSYFLPSSSSELQKTILAALVGPMNIKRIPFNVYCDTDTDSEDLFASLADIVNSNDALKNVIIIDADKRRLDTMQNNSWCNYAEIVAGASAERIVYSGKPAWRGKKFQKREQGK